jgi:hypothetical protein
LSVIWKKSDPKGSCGDYISSSCTVSNSKGVDMGEKGKKDTARREVKKKAKLTLKEKRKRKKEKKK